eukprot:c2563_g1_i1 orf=199-918(+)
MVEARIVHSKLGFGKVGASRDPNVPHVCGLPMLRLHDALPLLEEGTLAHFSIQDLACILQQCGVERHPGHALRLHAYMLETGLESHHVLGNYLVPMLVDVGNMLDAQRAFNRMVYRNEFSWNSLITGYVKCDKPHNALTLYERMRQDNFVQPDGHTFVAVFKACAQLKDLERGCELHTEVVKVGLLERNLVVGNALIDMYGKCGALTKAKQVFDSLPVRNVVTWTSLLGGYAECGHGEE